MSDRQELEPLADEEIIYNPASGEALDINAPAATLADALTEVDRYVGALKDHRARIVRELARRADAQAARTVELDGVKYKVNAPTEDVYDVSELEAALNPLIAAGIIETVLLDRLIVYPPPPPSPGRRVDKRRLNALLKSDDRRILAALASARTRRNNTRTVEVLARATNATAEEVRDGDDA